MVVEGIDNDSKRIALPALEVPLKIIGEYSVGLRVIEVDPNVKLLRIKENAYFGSLGGGSTL